MGRLLGSGGGVLGFGCELEWWEGSALAWGRWEREGLGVLISGDCPARCAEPHKHVVEVGSWGR